MKLDNIRTEDDLTPQVVRDLRISLGMTATDFWAPVGLSKAAASSNERRKGPLALHMRRLLFLTYVVGLDVNTGNAQNVSNLRALAALQGDTAGLLRIGATRAQLEVVRSKVNEAISAMDQVAVA